MCFQKRGNTKILTSKKTKNVSHHVTYLVRMTSGNSGNRKEITNRDTSIPLSAESSEQLWEEKQSAGLSCVVPSAPHMRVHYTQVKMT